MKVVNSDYTINGLRFQIASTIYRITGTKTSIKGVENAIDEVENTENNRVKELTRKQLKQMCDKFKAKIV